MARNHRVDLRNPAYPQLGRNVNHDPESRLYAVEADGAPTTTRWTRRSPVLDQGELGSCTGNAAAGALGTDPFFATIPVTVPLNEMEAIALYSAATKLDSAKGVYPPTDTGSDGLSVAKACKAAGLISGYKHAFSLAAAHTAIKSGPVLFGTVWLEAMFDPDSNGVVDVSGTEAGGHEYEGVGYDASTGLWECVNSWGTGWGKAGHFFIHDTDMAALLKNDGDVTVFVPLSQPAPVPTPAPVVDADADLKAAFELWLKRKGI